MYEQCLSSPTKLVVPSEARDPGFCRRHRNCRLRPTPGSLALLGMTIVGTRIFQRCKTKSLVQKARLYDAGTPAPRIFGPWRRYSISIGSTITNLPIEPLFRNLMRPVILAKRVSSLPRPTFRPGFTGVPRCVTMMVPPGTICPPNALNPSRCAFESRPFLEVPCPFLCAMYQLSVLDFQIPTTSFSWLRISSPPSLKRLSSSHDSSSHVPERF